MTIQQFIFNGDYLISYDFFRWSLHANMLPSFLSISFAFQERCEAWPLMPAFDFDYVLMLESDIQEKFGYADWLPSSPRFYKSEAVSLR